jgi:UDP-glucose 4-epimerase
LNSVIVPAAMCLDISTNHPSATIKPECLMGTPSSAAVYGHDHGTPIREDDTGIPVTPYGQNKFDAEAAIRERGCGIGPRWAALGEVEIAVGNPVATKPEPRRAGDPPHLVSDWGQAETQLGWRPNRSGLDQIVSSAWQWHRCPGTE